MVSSKPVSWPRGFSRPVDQVLGLGLRDHVVDHLAFQVVLSFVAERVTIPTTLFDDPDDLLIKHLPLLNQMLKVIDVTCAYRAVWKFLFKTYTFERFNSLCCISSCKSLHIFFKIDDQ